MNKTKQLLIPIFIKDKFSKIKNYLLAKFNI